MKMKAALIVDGLSLAEWQKCALEDASDYLDIGLVLNCLNTVTKRRYVKNFAYYLLNMFTLKIAARRVPCDIAGIEVIHFKSIYDGAWQSIPSSVVQRLKSENIKLVIKFGMSLLRIDEELSDIDIFSFHHGDPEQYRGRPAGFYELYNNDKRIGIVVQKLSNKLDAGTIFIRGYSKAYHHSYKRTAQQFYFVSRFLLRKALTNYSLGKSVCLEKLGPNYHLPGNGVVVKFVFKLMYRSIVRLLYGVFCEKKWNIVKYNFANLENLSRLSVSNGDVPMVKAGYTFYADPFFNVAGDKIRAEALNASNGLGEIVEIDAHKFGTVQTLLKGSHYSYPYSFEDMNKEYIIPEVASHSAPYLLGKPFDDSGKGELGGLEGLRIVDGTLFKNDGVYYFFGGLNRSAADCLYLYFSNNLKGPYRSHPQNPVVIDPSSARMGGRIVRCGEKLYRFGQNNCYGYGDGIAIKEIKCLDKESYSETNAGSIAFDDAHGPHTIDVCRGTAILDFYVDRVSLFAWYRRVAAKYWRQILLR